MVILIEHARTTAVSLVAGVGGVQKDVHVTRSLSSPAAKTDTEHRAPRQDHRGGGPIFVLAPVLD